ncbi:MAG: GGDEF domain-containing protein [Deltaproteobacteria bacterium]|nr:GGDEF domain-containing protein [Deltaproteobacteria bacterium]
MSPANKLDPKLKPDASGVGYAAGMSGFEELMEATYQTAKRLLPFLAKRRIPLTPYNYRLFYDYFAGNDDRLRERLDEILRNNTVMSPELSERLYHEFYDFIGDSARRLTLVGEKIGNISQDLEANLGRTLDSTGRYGQMLSDTASRMAAPGIADGRIKELMEGLINETRAAMSDQSDLAGHIGEANGIIAALTRELRDQTRLASVDELTQLYNRRYLTLQFASLVEKGGDDLLLSIVIFDLDRFKAVNDTYGHNIGDRVLLVCAKIIQNHAAPGGHLACRYGGEEFVLMCPGLPLEGACEIGEAVRRQVEGTAIQIRGNLLPVTLSGGVAQFRPGESFESMVERADRALYRAKSGGRNRIVPEDDLADEAGDVGCVAACDLRRPAAAAGSAGGHPGTVGGKAPPA